MNKKLVNVVDLITSVDKEIIALNYCEGHIRHHRECWNVLRKYMAEQGEIYLTPDIASQFLHDRYGIELYSQGKISCYKMLMRRSVLMLIEYQFSGKIYKRISDQQHEFPKEFEPLCEAYLDHLQNINLAAGTIRGHRRTIEYFTAYLTEQKITEIGQADMSVLHDYFRELTGCSKSYVNTVSQHLKAFFRFLYESGMYPRDVSGIWPNIRVERYCNLPETFSVEEAKRLLESVDRGNAIGKRDYAILLIAVRYGLRAGDIRALEFNNIDFRNQRIKLTQQKTGKPLEFALFDDVAWALIDYIKNGRPAVSTDSRIFVLMKAPYTGFSNNNNLAQIIYRYALKSGLTDNHKRCSMHMLRYTLASTLLSNNTPLPVVSSILGHSQLDTTKIYTKIDYNQLQMCALEVPHAE